MPMFHRLRFIASHALGGMAAVIALAATPSEAQDAFTVGILPSDVTSLAPRFAEVAGTYASYRIKPEVITIEGGSRGMQVLLSGKLQALHTGFSIAVNANREGGDVRMIAASSNAMAMEIYVAPAIRSAAYLKGQKIAVSTFASETDMAVSLALRQWNMTRKDVVVVPLGGASQRLAAQLSGQVAASPYVTPATIAAREKGLVRLLDLGNGAAPWVLNGLMVNSDFAKSNPDLITRFVKANIEGVYKALSDEKWAKEIIAKEYKTDSYAVIDDANSQIKKNFPRDFTPSAEAISNVITEVNNLGPPLANKAPSAYVDLCILDALNRGVL